MTPNNTDGMGIRQDRLANALIETAYTPVRTPPTGHSKTDGVELRLLHSWLIGRIPSWLTTIWAA
jgi:hypothetical protein